jgi:hypothetical protein
MFDAPLGEGEFLIAESCQVADHVAVMDWGWRRVSPGRYIRPGTTRRSPRPVSYIDREHGMNGLRGRVVHVGYFHSSERRRLMLEFAQAVGLDFAGSLPNDTERRYMRDRGAQAPYRRTDTERTSRPTA